jgi:catechol 2,3-dioxygenase-like lactoylglutathione lyase family enzyme
MSVQLNHTIVHSRDQQAAAEFLASILGLPPPTRFAHFHVVQLANGVSIDYMTTPGDIARQHYAFLVSDAEFDPAFARVRERGLRFWADPAGHIEGELNHRDGGRGFYFADPSGHWLEIITRPYGADSGRIDAPA